MKRLSNLDMAKNEIQNVAIQNLSSDPSSPVSGQIYFNTTDGKLKQYTGSAWIEYSTATSSGDASTNTSTSVDSEVALFFGTTGKTLKRATQTGIPKLTSGVMGTATEGSDYYGVGATDVAVTDGGTGRSTGTTAYGIIAAGTTATGAQQTISPGTSGQFLKSGGPSALGSFATISESDVTNLTTDLAAKAPLASPALTGTPTAPTASPATNNTQIATTAYVDAATTAAANGFDVKASVRAATTATVTLAGSAPNTVDGVTLAANDRILVKNQSTASQNGIYYVSTLGTGSNGTWTRATDADSSAEVTSGLYTFVTEGTTNGSSGWVLTTADPITLATTSLTFTQFTGLGQVTAGTGLSKSANTLSIDTTVTVDKTTAQALSNKDMTAGTNTWPTFNQNTTGSAAKLTTARNINGVAFDGTANITIPGNKATGNLGDGSTTSIAITDGLGSIDKIAVVRDATTGAQIECDITYSSTQTTFGFGTAPATNAYKYVIMV